MPFWMVTARTAALKRSRTGSILRIIDPDPIHRAMVTPSLSGCCLSLPLLSRNQHDRLELLAPQRGVDSRELARRPCVEVARHVGKLPRHRVGALGLGLRSEEHTSELQSHSDLVCRLLLEKKKTNSLP